MNNALRSTASVLCFSFYITAAWASSPTATLSAPAATLSAPPAPSAPPALSASPALSAPPADTRPIVALALAGGGAWGLSHIGVIKVLEEAGIPVDIVAGTSMGAIIGGLYSTGYNSSELDSIARATDWDDLLFEGRPTGTESYQERMDAAKYLGPVHFTLDGISMNGGIIPGHKIVRYMDILTLHIPASCDFDQLPRKFRAVATDVTTGEKVIFREGSLVGAMRASMSIPGVFSPWEENGRVYVDGFVVDNLPITVARSLEPDIVIAVNLVDETPFDPESLNRTPISPLSRSLAILLDSNIAPQLSSADLVITVNMAGYLQTDYNKVSELIDLGEQYARKHADAVDRIAQRTAARDLQDTQHNTRIAQELPVRVTGLGERERNAFIQKFEAARSDQRDPLALQKAFEDIDRSRSYGAIRVRRSPGGDGVIAVDFQRKKVERNSVRLGFTYETTFSSAITNNINLVPSFVFSNVTTSGSRLTIDAEVLDAPGIEIRFSQPIVHGISLRAFTGYQRDFTTRLTTTSVGYQYETGLLSSGIEAAAAVSPGVEVTAGWKYERIDTEFQTDTPAGTPVQRASFGFARLAINLLDSSIFPMSGLDIAVDYHASIPQIGSERFFHRISSSGSTFLSLGTPFSVALLWKAGTDFSMNADEGAAAPAFYKPDLSGRRMFAGPLSEQDRTGSHVAALGVELKNNINWGAKGINFPVFILAQASTGAVIHDREHFALPANLFSSEASIGAGVRLSEAFGFSLRMGSHRTSGGTFRPFIALDVGAIGY